MVVAVLMNRFAPSSRGLKRADPSVISLASASGISQSGDLSSSYRNLEEPSGEPKQKAMIGHRRKPFRAMACLTSLASDINVVSDWFFYWETLQNDRSYRSQHRQGEEVFLIPPLLLTMVLLTCIIGTIMWLILATDGQIVTPLLRRLGFDKLSMGFLLFLCVVLEDVPQVVLTFLVEDFYQQDMFVSNFAVWNVTSSLYDTMIKMAEAYDERHDLVETGAWCKHSVAAHKDQVVTCVIVLSSDASIRRQHGLSSRRQSATTADLMAPSSLPRLQFLTASLDTSVRLWNCVESPIVHGEHETTCSQVFQGHVRGVTCLTLLEPSNFLHNGGAGTMRGPFFLSGCQNGTVNLWSSQSAVCLRRYTTTPDAGGVTSVAVVNDAYMVAGYGDGTCRLFEIGTGACRVIFRGHVSSNTTGKRRRDATIHALCSMEDESTFVSASEDGTICLWDVSSAVQNPRFPGSSGDSDSIAPASEASAKSVQVDGWIVHEDGPDEEMQEAQTPSDLEHHALTVPSSASSAPTLLNNVSRLESQPPLEITECEQKFTGHTKAVLCVACMEAGSVFASGSKDCKVRLWSATTGACLNIISGHDGPITALAPMDAITLLTGSHDKSVKAWDCLSANCLRTYTGHEGTVTSIAVAEDSFITTSEDGTAKLWVVTAVEERPKSFDLLDVNDGLCRGFDPI